ncbi:putative lipid II flippase FtsW [Candidatus Parcubacteria bacterium]|nr:putative lipid II flippase FtsW [Patescibacteria group bacterium]MCG2688853.1 putative lipid II flippase FtsW [Candidatus Parcubacteria bacterium]
MPHHKEKRFLDLPFFIATLAILFFGVVMVYDSSVVYSLNLFGGKFHFLISQGMWALFGILCFFMAFFLPLDWLFSKSRALYIFSVLLLILVLLPTPFSPMLYGARRWLFLNPEPFPAFPLIGRLGFQPSDLMKLTYLLYLAKILSLEKDNDVVKILKRFFVVTFIPVLLVLLEPDLGTALLLLVAGVVMLFVWGFPVKYFAVMAPVFLVLATIAVVSSPYRKERFLTFVGNNVETNQDKSYHVRQAQIALGSGGIFGRGLGQSRQKYGYLPEVTSDSIYAIVGEEFGFIGTTLTLFGIVFIVLRGLELAKRTKIVSAKIFGCGVITVFGLQAFLNTASMLGLVPLTGVPLPLISYGGSSMVITLLGFGLTMNFLSS